VGRNKAAGLGIQSSHYLAMGRGKDNKNLEKGRLLVIPEDNSRQTRQHQWLERKGPTTEEDHYKETSMVHRAVGIKGEVLHHLPRQTAMSTMHIRSYVG
jgi:hypothetical protein